ncbi:MAG: Mu transposase C-terminal domain-containing protein [Bradyrhizobium sp.]
MFSMKPKCARLVLGPLDKITIKGRDYRWQSSDEFGHVLLPTQSLGQPVAEGFSDEELNDLLSKDQFQHEVFYYDEAKVRARLRAGGAISLFQLTDKEQAVMLERQEFCDLLLQKEAADPKFKRTDASIKDALVSIFGVICERNAARVAEGKSQRCDQKFEMGKCPAPRTVRRWLKAYEECGLDIMALRDGHHRSGNEFSSLDPGVYALVVKHANAWADIRRPSMKGQHEALTTEINLINQEREADGQPQLKIPAKSTFRRAIKKIPAFEAYAGRHGAEAAKRKFTVVGSGMTIIRPFQRLVMDGWKTQLSTINVKMGEWDLMTPADKKKAERVRLVLHGSECTATRCVTGIRYSTTENKETAIATLRMSVSDKSAYAKAAGCKSDWPMTARPGSVHTDTGSAWIATEFRSSVADLRATLENAPVGVPQHRGHFERLFGTLDRGFLPNFSGRTFANVVDKGDYDPGAEASMFVDKIGGPLIRYIVDKYHHTPHAGLFGKTPYEAWHELVDKYGILPKPGRDELRNVFGPKVERSLDHRGVRIAGIHYQSAKLQEYRRKIGDGKVAVKFDPEDLGRVSVWVDEGWLAVPAMRGKFDHVHLNVWVEAMKDLRRRNLVQANLSRHYVDEALLAISAIGSLPWNARISRHRPSQLRTSTAMNANCCTGSTSSERTIRPPL